MYLVEVAVATCGNARREGRMISKMADPLENVVIKRENVVVKQEKNFVKQNILRVKRSSPAEPKRRFVDTRYGDTHDLERSGLLSIYVHKKNYGKRPNVVAVDAVRVETGKTAQRLDGEKVSRVAACRDIDKEERRILLAGMKQKWEEAMKQFRGLPFLADTLPKAQRQARMERELQQLETDIAIIEQHPHIYVYDDVLVQS